MHLYGINLYRGKELLFSNGYSFIIPKASPLKVCIYLTMFFKLYWGNLCLTEGPVHGHRLVSGHRHLREDVAGCDLQNQVTDDTRYSQLQDTSIGTPFFRTAYTTFHHDRNRFRSLSNHLLFGEVPPTKDSERKMGFFAEKTRK